MHVESSPVKILVPGNHLMAGLLGQQDEFLRLVEDENPGAHISVRGNEITIGGDDAERIGRLFEEMIIVLEAGQTLDSAQVRRTIDMMHDDVRPSEVLTAELLRSSRGRAVRPKTAGQKQYADAIASNVVTFGIGPAGTGKSYLAVALAVQALQAHQVSKIILTRPAVEAGERLGFLPGDLMAKVDPYLRPLYDALHDLLEPEGSQRLLDRGTIEVAPLAFMRGRTLNSSFIILDEAQNTSPEQMKMFLTRIGFGSKAVITGDVTQIDIPGGRSGLVGLEPVLSGVKDLAFVHLTQRDVVRHRVVADIVAAYERGSGSPVPAGDPVRCDAHQRWRAPGMGYCSRTLSRERTRYPRGASARHDCLCLSGLRSGAATLAVGVDQSHPSGLCLFVLGCQPAMADSPTGDTVQRRRHRPIRFRRVLGDDQPSRSDFLTVRTDY